MPFRRADTDLKSSMGIVSCLILVFSPLVLAPGLVDYSNGPKAAFIQLSIALLAGIWAAGIHKEGKIELGSSPLHLPVAAFLLWVGLSTFWAHNHYLAWKTFCHWVACGFFYVVAAGPLSKGRWPFRLLQSIPLALAAVVIIGCIQFLFDVRWTPSNAIPPASTFEHKNFAVHIVSMGLPVLAAFCLQRLKGAARLLLPSLLVLTGAYLFFTGTRAGWVAAAAAGAFLAGMIFNHRTALFVPYRRDLAKTAAAFIAAAVLFAAGASAIADKKIGRSGANILSTAIEKRDSGRLKLWGNTLAMLADRPLFGYGLSNFSVFYPLYHDASGRSHLFGISGGRADFVCNDFLQIAVETGVIGGILFLFLPITFFRTSYRLLKEAPAPDETIWIIALNAGFIGFLVEAGFDFPMQKAVPVLYLFTFLGLLSGYCSHKREGSVKGISTEVPGYVSAAALAIASIAFLSAGLYHYSNLMSSYYFKKMAHAGEQGFPDIYVSHGRRSVELNPSELRVQAMLGTFYIGRRQYEKGIEYLDRVIDKDPYNVNSLMNKGIALIALNRTDAAIEVIRRVTPVKPEWGRPYLELGDIYFRKKAYPQALENYLLAGQRLHSVQDAPLRMDALFRAGLLQKYMGRYQQAASTWEKLLVEFPGFSDVHGQLAVLYDRHLDRPEKAAPHMTSYIAAQPDGELSESFRAILDRSRTP